MNILQVVPYFFPSTYGGPGKTVYDLSRWLAGEGHTVTIFTSDCYDETHRMPDHRKIHIKNIRVYYFRNLSNTLAYRFHLFLPVGMVSRATSVIPHMDVVHIHDFYIPANIWIYWLCLFYRKPYVVTVHGCLSLRRMKDKSFYKKLFMRLFGLSILRNASLLIALSEEEKNIYKTYGIAPGKIVILGHGIDSAELKISVSKVYARKYFSLRRDHVVVTYLGRLDKIKGLDLLVKAASKLPKNVTVVVAGPDHGYKRILESASSIRLLPQQYGESKKILLKASDIFVYPSYSEGFSLAILEAAGVGLPVVVTTACQFPAIAIHKAGIVVTPTADALANGIRQLLQSRVKRRRYGANARLFIQRYFSMDTIGRKYVHLYETFSR